MTMNAYTWDSTTWHHDTATSKAPDEQVVVSANGDRRPVADLMRALFDGAARPVVVADKACAPVTTPAPVEIQAGDHDAAGAARAMKKVEAAAELGVTLPSSKKDGLFYELGTAVMDSAWSAERQAFDAMPSADRAVCKIIDAIREEDRKDRVFDAWDVRMSKSSGKIGTPAAAWKPSKQAMSGWLTRAGVRGLDPQEFDSDLVAPFLNSVLTRKKEAAKRSALAVGAAVEEPRMVLRVQEARGKAFAAVSESFAKFDGDLVLEALKLALPQGAKASGFYDPDTSRGRVEIVTLQEEKPVVGEAFRASFTVGWHDGGGSSVWGDGGLFSARCLNLTRIYTEVGKFRIRHIGDVKKLSSKFRQEFDRIAAILGRFSDAYGEAAQEELTNAERIEAAEFMKGIYRSLIQRDLVPVRGKREEAAGALAMQAMVDENKAGLTRAGIANGITRYAHRVNDDPWFRDEMERAAGRVLWNDRAPLPLLYAPEAA